MASRCLDRGGLLGVLHVGDHRGDFSETYLEVLRQRGAFGLTHGDEMAERFVEGLLDGRFDFGQRRQDD